MSLIASSKITESADAHCAFLAVVKRMRSTSSKSSLRQGSQKLSERATPYPSRERRSKRRCGRTGRAGPVRERSSTPSTATDSSVPNTPEHPSRLPLPLPNPSCTPLDAMAPRFCREFTRETIDIDTIFQYSDPFCLTTFGKQDADYLGLSLTPEPEMDQKQDALVAEMFAKYIDLEGGQTW